MAGWVRRPGINESIEDTHMFDPEPPPRFRLRVGDAVWPKFPGRDLIVVSGADEVTVHYGERAYCDAEGVHVEGFLPGLAEIDTGVMSREASMRLAGWRA